MQHIGIEINNLVIITHSDCFWKNNGIFLICGVHSTSSLHVLYCTSFTKETLIVVLDETVSLTYIVFLELKRRIKYNLDNVFTTL